MFPVPTLCNRWTLCQASGQSVPDNLSLCPRSRLRYYRRGILLVLTAPHTWRAIAKLSCRLL